MRLLDRHCSQCKTSGALNTLHFTWRTAFILSLSLVFAARKLGYYIVQVIIPLTFIVMMSWIVFWLTPSESGTQISVAITAVLTLIAYRFTIGNELPHISYLTRMDIFLMGSTILVFAALLEAALTSRLMKAGNRNLTIKMDLWSRIIFPLCFTGLVVFAFLL